MDGASRAALPEGCFVEDRPHTGFADVITKVARSGTTGTRTSAIRLGDSKRFVDVASVGVRGFDGSPKRVPVVGFELNATFYLADAAIRCDRDARCVAGDGATVVQLADLAEAAAVSAEITRRPTEASRRLRREKLDFHDPLAGAMGSMKPLKADVSIPWVATAEDEVTDYVTGTKS